MYAGEYYDAASKYKGYVILGCKSFQLDYEVFEFSVFRLKSNLNIANSIHKTFIQVMIM